jgi:hypothetical protein
MLSIPLRCHLSPTSHDCCLLLRESRWARTLKQDVGGRQTSGETTERSTEVTVSQLNHHLADAYWYYLKYADKTGEGHYVFSAFRWSVEQFQESNTKSKENGPSVSGGFRHTLVVFGLIGLFVLYVVCLSVQMLVRFVRLSASRR